MARLPSIVALALVAACASGAPSPPSPRAPLLSQLAAAARAPATSTSSGTLPAPPAARREPHETKINGRTLVDDYYWLRQKDSPEVVHYLEAENAYTEAVTAGLRPLVDKLYEEGVSRLQETDATAPARLGEWLYYSRTVKGKQYPILCRKHAGVATAPEVVLVDPNEIGKTEPFVQIGDERDVTDDGNLYAYTLDTTGFRQYALHLKDLRTGKELPEHVARVDSIAFARDGRTLFYVTEDAQTKRANQAYRHVLGEDPAKDEVVYEEKDPRFELSLRRSRSRDFVVMTSASMTTTEVRLIDARHPTMAPRLVEPRSQGHEYYVEPGKSVLYVRTNAGGRNFRVMTAPLASSSPEGWARAAWKELVPYRPEVMIEDVEAFADHVVLRERQDAKVTWRSLDAKTGASHRIGIDEQVYSLVPERGEPNLEFASDTFRYAYSSPTTPRSVYEENVRSGSRTLLKRDTVPGFEPSRYASQRVHATARDGTEVPVSIVYPQGLMPDGSHPVFMQAYGSYGIPFDVGFDSALVSLLDRGVICAVAHIRGGGDLGKTWHDAGRMATKMNTFTDFIDVAEWLSKTGWAKKGQIGIMGGSAGGLLMGAVANLRPDLWRAVVARVPFVDVMSTMLDETLPLTSGEFEEWGNPKLPDQFDWMMAYSPYDNVAKKTYPPLLVETSYNDSQVMYWEPAKYVAKLRSMKTDTNPLLLRTNMKPAGHGGLSGRYDHLRERAFDHAFILDELGVTPPG